MLVPLAAASAGALGQDPLTLAIPATLAASCAFMMPVATPPNAIIFGARRLTVLQMCAAGFLVNLLAVLMITLWTLLLEPKVF